MNNLLKNRDPQIFNLITKEFIRQKKSLELIASENFTSKSVLECVGSILTNKYAEGQPGARYYGGCDVVDNIENLCKERALNAFNLNDKIWGVNVQPYSGSPANFAVYNALLKPHDRIMGLDLPSGGHLTHGFFTDKKKISATSVFYESLPYCVNEEGYIDYENLENLARIFKPKLIICGGSAYPRDIDYRKFRDIANINKSYLMCDMAHISGFIAKNLLNSPFEYCDIVTSTTHKTLRGPRSGLIFFKKEYEESINFSVFPMLQGGPHIHQIAGVATQLKEVNEESYLEYMKNVLNNARVLAKYFMDNGYKVMTNGTDNHIILLNLRNKNITGSKIEKICERVDISLNKNSVYGDKSASSPSGIRIGTCALTTRNLNQSDFLVVGELIHKTINLALKIQNNSFDKKLSTFMDNLENYNDELESLKLEVNNFADKFDFIEI